MCANVLMPCGRSRDVDLSRLKDIQVVICMFSRVCHNVKLLSFCHPERSRRVSRKLMGDVSTSLRYAQHDSMIGLLHFDTPSC